MQLLIGVKKSGPQMLLKVHEKYGSPTSCNCNSQFVEILGFVSVSWKNPRPCLLTSGKVCDKGTTTVNFLNFSHV